MLFRSHGSISFADVTLQSPHSRGRELSSPHSGRKRAASPPGTRTLRTNILGKIVKIGRDVKSTSPKTWEEMIELARPLQEARPSPWVSQCHAWRSASSLEQTSTASAYLQSRLWSFDAKMVNGSGSIHSTNTAESSPTSNGGIHWN